MEKFYKDRAAFSARVSRSRFARVLVVAAITVVAVLVYVPVPARAAGTIYANSATGNDSTGDGSLANPYLTFHKAYTSAAAGDTINLAGTFTWTDAGETGDAAGSGYTLGKNLTIVGQTTATTIVQAAATRGAADRMVFYVGANVTVGFRDLTIRYGKVTGEGQGAGITLAGAYCGFGRCPTITGTATLDRVAVTMNDAAAIGTNTMYRAGGIYMQEASTITITNSSITSNTCSCYGYSAGGIAGGEQSQSITMEGSLVANNTATSTAGSTWPYSYLSVAGGLAVQRSGILVARNSTFYGNATDHYAGGLNINYPSQANLTNVTVVNNSAARGAGGILWTTSWNSAGNFLYLKNSMVANNTGIASANDDFYAYDALSASEVTASHSIVETQTGTSVSFSGTGMVTGQQASLDLAAGLSANGSLSGVESLAIGASSIARDAGNSAAHGSPSTVAPTAIDQRGSARVGTYDIGAFEYNGVAGSTDGNSANPLLSSSSPTDNALNVAETANIALTFSEAVVPVSDKYIRIRRVSDNSIFETIPSNDGRVSISGAVATIDPDARLEYSTDYYVEIDAGAFTDTVGNPFGGVNLATTLNFTTRTDTFGPVLSSSSPSDNATGVGVSSNIALTFDENVVAVASKNITIKRSTDNSTFETIAVTDPKVTISGKTVTIDPSGTFASTTGYYVLIDSGAFKDSLNNSYGGIASATTLNFTSADVVAPTLASSTPADGASGVLETANISLTFSEAVLAVTGKNVILKHVTDDSVFESIDAANSKITVSSTTVTINPAGTLVYSTGYYLEVEAGAFRDASGNTFAGILTATDLNFTVRPDTFAPTLSSSTPTDGASSVAVASNIVLTFNETVTAATGKNVTIVATSSGATFETIPASDPRVSVSGAVVTINPTSNLAYGTAYHVLVDAGAFKDTANNDYAGISLATTLNFTSLVDTTAPTLSSRSPSQAATNVVETSDIVLTFSEGVVAGAGKNITIKKYSDDSILETISATDSKVTISGTTVTINPASRLGSSTMYYVLVDNGAFKDAAGNNYTGITSKTSYYFTARLDNINPTLASSAPADNATGVAVNANIVLAFDEPVTAVTAKNITIYKGADDSVFETIGATNSKVTISGTTVTINPTGTFDSFTDYYVLVDSGAFKDAVNLNYGGITSKTALNFVSLDTSFPFVASSSPADDVTGVSRTANIVLTFSETVTAVSGKYITIKRTSDDSVVETIAANDSNVGVSGAVVTIDPSSTFDYSTSYYVLLDVGAFKDVSNNDSSGIADSTTLNFTTLADVVAPTLSSSTPADDATGVSQTANIVLTFSETVTGVSGKNVSIRRSSDNTVFESIDATDAKVSISGATVTINPSGTFAYSTGYYVLVDVGAFLDPATNGYAGIAAATTLNFATLADVVAPTLSSSTPADDATGVSQTANIVLTFSEAMVAVAGKNVTIRRTSDNITFETIPATDARVSISGSTVTINPSGSFDYSTGYYVMVEAGAFTDTASNAFAGITTSTALDFIALADTTAPTMLSLNPADNATGVSRTANIVLTFNEPVFPGAGRNIAVRKTSDGSLFEAIPATDSRVSISGSSVTINPSGAFAYATTYYVVIESGAFEDSAGNAYAGISSPTGFDFITETDVSTTATTTTTTVAASTGSAAAAATTTSTTSSTTSTTAAPATTTSTTSTTLPVVAARPVWYVDSEVGSDTNLGSQASPLRTFTRAYSLAKAGDIIDLTGTFSWSDPAETGDVAGAGFRIAKAITIRGQGDTKTVVEAGPRASTSDRPVFTISATVTIRDLAIRHGRVLSGSQGGGITNQASLTLISTTVEDNIAAPSARSSYYNAGGVFSGTNSTLVIDKSTIRDNVCTCTLYGAGGVWALQSVRKTITNSTFSGNRGSSSWGATFPFSYASVAGAFGTFRFGFTVITNSTFFGNSTDNYGGALVIYYQEYAHLTNVSVVANSATRGAGGILYQSEWTGYNLNMKNVLAANNRTGSGDNDFHAYDAATAGRMTESYNLVESSTNKTFSGVGNITGPQPSLDLAASLAPNSGRNGVDTLLIGRDSVAKDAGSSTPNGARSPVAIPATDQRGLSRAGAPDIGAFENQSETTSSAEPVVPPSSSTSTTSSTTSTTIVRATTTTAVQRTTTTVESVTASRVTTTTTASDEEPTSTVRTRNAALPTTTAASAVTSTLPEIVINPDMVATTVPTASTIPEREAEDLTVEPKTETEIVATNGNVEIVLSVVDKSFAEIVRGETGGLVAKKGLFAKVRAKGFMPGSLAEVWMFSTPRLLGHLQVSSRGEAAGFVLIPDDSEIGDHRIEFRGNSNKRNFVKASVPLKILGDAVVPETIPPTAEAVASAVTLPTEIPAVVIPAPVDGQVSISEDVIKSVLAEVLGDSVDLSKVKLRIRINKGEWRLIDTSTGRVLALVVPAASGENQIEFEVTDPNGQVIVVEREVLVEGTPEAEAYIAQAAADDDSSVPSWLVPAVSAALLGAFALVIVAGRRRRTL